MRIRCWRVRFILIALFGSCGIAGSILAAPAVQKMILIPGACFEMGSEVYVVEEPVHAVCLSSFYMEPTEVTQKDFQRVLQSNPSAVKGETLPVTNVTWSEADRYCRAMGRRLPSEAEWEYAAGQGNESFFAWGYDMEDQRAWHRANSGGTPHPVGQTRANSFDLYDLNGNVWEWVADWLDLAYYETSPENNPVGPANGQFKILRGGSFEDPAGLLRTAYRYWYPREVRNGNLGFRCAGNAPGKKGGPS